jgi:hypothetical protein
MRGFLTVLLLSGMAWGQAADPANASAQAASTSQSKAASQASDSNAAPARETTDPNLAEIPAGTTTFPFVVNDRILVPAGTYIQGKISRVEKAGRSIKRAELLLHFTSMIYPSGYTVMLPASVQNTPGEDDKSVKDKEGTIQADKDTGKRVEDAAKGAAVGGTVGSIGGLAAGGLNGARYGGLAGIAGGVAWALLKHGPDVKLPVGTSIEMEIQRPISVDASRIQVARAIR